MKKLYRTFFRAMLCFALAIAISSPSHADTTDLLNLLGNKAFWTDFKWEKFEDTELYKAAEWRPPGWPGRSGVTVTSCYTIMIKWRDLGVDQMTLYEDSGAISSPWDLKDLKKVWGTSGSQKSGAEYKMLVDWCNEKFGDPLIKDEKTEMVLHDRVVNNVKTSWAMGTTIISVTTEDTFFLANDKHSFLTKLAIEKNRQTHQSSMGKL